MRSAKLITVNCNNCNRKVHATVKQFLDGLVCPGCGLPVSLGAEDQLNHGKSFLHKSTCVSCGCDFDIPFQHSFKYMAECPKCNTLFIRDNIILDDFKDRETEAFRLLETLYPSLPNNLTEDMSDATPASEQELKLLADLKIQAKSSTSRSVQRVAKSIFDIINVAILSHYNSILYFPYEIRSVIYLDIAKTPLMRKIYFDQHISIDDLEPIVKKSLNDDELYQALCTNLDVASFEIAVAYIVNYAKVIFNRELEDHAARMLALKCFARGIGWNIRHAGYFIYSQEENVVKSIAHLSPTAMKSFYTCKNKVNDALEEMLTKAGWKVPPRRGCLSVLFFLLLPAAALFWR